MIQGTSSNVGKSLIVAGLCRIYARRGLKVFPFKSQNMALNSFVTPEGLEIGRAQALQAVAAMRPAEVAMNPVLLKPEANSRCQVVLMGKPWKSLRSGEYYTEKGELWEQVCRVMEKVQKENDLLIVEGAGSPAEINLKEHEIVNMKVARHLGSPVLLAADIDRGGVFAFLYGTLALLEEEERALVKGYIINKFRGDVKLLEPGLKMIADLTDGRPTVGVVPFLKDIALAQEDSVFLQDNRSFGEGSTDIAVILLPHISNYDDFDALLMEKGVRVRFVETLHELGAPSAIILPGTKTTIADLIWMQQSGLAEAVKTKAASGTPVAGICGGYQMLGNTLVDKDGVEGAAGERHGLGLLDITTHFVKEKETIQSEAEVVFGGGFLGSVKGCKVQGYEIHMGRSEGKAAEVPLLITDRGSRDGAASGDGRIWGTYFHGIFDSVDFRRGWLESLGWKAEGKGLTLAEKREQELDSLADTLESHLDMQLLDRIIGL
jgi:adenosylcobyric acid synthase